MPTCECGASVKNPSNVMHLNGRQHQVWLGEANGPLPNNTPKVFDPAAQNGLDPALQGVVDAVHQTPQERAKTTRQIFGSKNWPNEEHAGTVRDFLQEHNIPIINPKVEMREKFKESPTESTTAQYVNQRNKELAGSR